MNYTKKIIFGLFIIIIVICPAIFAASGSGVSNVFTIDNRQEDTLVTSKLTIKGGKERDGMSDSFSMTGQFGSGSLELISAPANDLANIAFAIYSESEDEVYGHEELFNPQNIKVDAKRQKISYKNSFTKGQSGGITSFKADLAKGTFTITGKDVDFTGMQSPVMIGLSIGNYFGNSIAYDGEVLGSGGDLDIINGSKPLPANLLAGCIDYLSIAKTTKLKEKDNLVSTSVSGSITARESFTINLENEPLIITWGDNDFTIPADSCVGKGAKFAFKKITATEGGVFSGIIDFGKCTYKISIKNAPLNTNADTFGLTFGTFSQTVNIVY